MLALERLNFASPRKINSINKTMFKKLNKTFYVIAYSLIFAASVAAGINYAIIKNKQTLVQRDIDEVVKRTTKNNNLLNQYKAELQNTNNRFLLKERVKAMDTALKPIPANSIVTVQTVAKPELAENE